GQQVIANGLRRDLRMVALDQAALAELADALVDGGRREPDLRRKLRLRRARVLLQQLDQREIDVVDIGHALSGPGDMDHTEPSKPNVVRQLTVNQRRNGIHQARAIRTPAIPRTPVAATLSAAGAFAVSGVRARR